jgi:anti-sigma B factor antagonist
MVQFEQAEPGIVVVTFDEQRIDAANSPALRKELISLIEAGTSQLVLNMREVRFIDSSGLGMVVTLLKRAGMRGGVALCAMQAPVAATFRLARMDRVFPMHADVPSALASLR